MLLDSNGVIIDLNPAFESMTTINRTELIGKTVDTVLENSNSEVTVFSVIRENDLLTPINVLLKGPGLSLSATSIFFQAGEQGAVYCLSFSKKTDLLTRENFADANRFSVFGYLIPGIAHNINNPLAVIIGRAQLMKLKYPDIKDMELIQEQAIQIKNIVEALSFKAGRELSDTEAPINFSALLQNELTILSADPFFKHSVIKHIDISNTDPPLSGKYRDLSAALLSLINYSLDSMLETTRKEFNLRLCTDHSDIKITISDTGKPSEQAETPESWLNQEVYQSPRMGKHLVDLPKAHSIIEKYNGKICLVRNNPAGKEIQINIHGNSHAE